MIKYRLPYKSFDNSEWLVTFDIKDFEGDALNVRGVAGQACTITYEGSAPDDVWRGIMTTASTNINIYNQGQINLLELLSLNDRDCIVTVTRNGEVKHMGYLISDGLYIDYQASPYPIQLRSICGLSLLSSMQFAPFGAELGTRCPLNYFRRILTQQLGIDLPIRWSTSLQALNDQISGDPFVNAKWSQYGDGVIINPTTNRTQYQSCEYIIEGLAKALQCRVFQADGAWWVLGIHEHHKDIISYSECSNSSGLPIITEHIRDNVKQIGTQYPFVNEDARILSNPGLSSFEITYEHSQLENILPNGGMDQWTTGTLMWWTVDSSTNMILQQYDAITGRGGKAVELWNIGTSDRIFKLYQPLPVDAHTLFSTFQWGFSFLPIEGYPVDGDGFIDWSTRPLKASVKYTVEENGAIVDYYLNEFGYWQSQGEIVSGTLRYDKMEYTTNITLNLRTVKVFFSGIPALGDEMTINMREFNNNSNSYKNFTHIVDAGTAGDLQLAMDSLKNALPSRITTKSVTMTGTNEGYISYQDFIPNGMPTAFVVNYANSETFKYIHFHTIDPLRLNIDIVSFNYQGAGSLENKFVNPGNIDISTLDGAGLLSVEFIIEPGQRLALDEVWMKTNSNKDVYKVSYNDLGNNKSDNDNLNISTSFSGFMGSNLMQRYSTSNIDWKYTDGFSTGTLTDLYAQALMRFRYRSSIIFEGSISTRGKDWSYIDSYTIDGLEGKYMPCSYVSYNTENNEVRLIAMQARNDNIQLTVEHYGTEDQEKDNLK